MRCFKLTVCILLLWHMQAVAQVAAPAKPAFIVTYEETGKNPASAWNYSATVKFSVSNWSSWPNKVVGKPIEFDPGLFLKLDPGDIVNFYMSDVDETGKGDDAHYTLTLTPDGTETVVESSSSGTETIITTDSDYRSAHNIPMNEVYCLNARYYMLGNLAELERTETGGILRAYTAVGRNLGEWGVSQETMEQVFPEVETFVLSDAEIKEWQSITRTKVGSGSYEGENLTVKVSVKMNTQMAEVSLDGCLQFGVDYQGSAVAEGTPEGGSYDFSVEPPDLMTVDAIGPTAVLKASRPGRGTLTVRYSAPGGGEASASAPVSAVAVWSYNHGDTIPQIALYDIKGNKTPAMLSIPYLSMPENVQELIDLVPGNPEIITVTPYEEYIDILGLSAGRSTLEAKDNCGNTVGPVIEIEVVNCDRETVERLEKLRKGMIENLKAATTELQKTASSAKFEKAREEVVWSTADLLAKVGLTIIGGGETAGAVKTATDIAEAGAAISDMIGSSNDEEFVANTIKAIIQATGTELSKVILDMDEVYKAGDKLGNELLEIASHEADLKNALDNYEKADKELQEIIRVQTLCKSTEEIKEPKKEPVPEQPEPPVKPKQPEDKPSSGKPGDETPVPGDPEPPVDQPPPKEWNVALPYLPYQCGCENKQALSAGSESLSQIQSGFLNLEKCVRDFNNVTVNGYIKTLNDWTGVYERLNTAAAGSNADFLKVAAGEEATIKTLTEATRTYEKSGKTFLSEIEKCPESVKNSLEVTRSASAAALGQAGKQ